MSGLYLKKDNIGILENQKKGLCLITAFFQGLYLNNKEMSHQTESMITDDIVYAMKFIVEHKVTFSNLTSRSMSTIDSWSKIIPNRGSLIDSVAKNNGLHPGEFWNIEILERYISEAKIPVSIFYYMEVILIYCF